MCVLMDECADTGLFCLLSNRSLGHEPKCAAHTHEPQRRPRIGCLCRAIESIDVGIKCSRSNKQGRSNPLAVPRDPSHMSHQNCDSEHRECLQPVLMCAVAPRDELAERRFIRGHFNGAAGTPQVIASGKLGMNGESLSEVWKKWNDRSTNNGPERVEQRHR